MAKPRPELPAFGSGARPAPEIARFISTGEVKDDSPRTRMMLELTEALHLEALDLAHRLTMRGLRGKKKVTLQAAAREGLTMWCKKAKQELGEG